MQLCTLLQTDNHASTPPVFYRPECPSCRPTNSIKALKAQPCHYSSLNALARDIAADITILVSHVSTASLAFSLMAYKVSASTYNKVFSYR